jgi:hypothetical protein
MQVSACYENMLTVQPYADQRPSKWGRSTGSPLGSGLRSPENRIGADSLPCTRGQHPSYPARDRVSKPPLPPAATGESRYK